MSDRNSHTRCQQTVSTLNKDLDWSLDAQAQARYTAALHTYVSADMPAAQLRRMVINYHADHERVEALLDLHHQQHTDEWLSWMRQVTAILHKNGLTWSQDAAYDAEDLAQIARTALFRGLPDFRYASRFSTWAYRVVVQSVQRHIRARHTQKRTGQLHSLEANPVLDVPIDERENPETIATARLLAQQVAATLGSHPDGRLARLFELWATEDRKVEEIGALVQLHPSRVRALLAQARHVLQHDPGVQQWLDTADAIALGAGHAQTGD